MIQGDSFRLIMRRGPQPNQTYDLNKDIITIGRDITNDYVINDPEVSRHHMRFTRGADGYALEDLGSTNGTFVNGQRLSGARPLRSGDMIGLGETVTLTYEVVSAARASDPGAAYTAPGAPRPVAPAQPQPGYISPQQPGVYPHPQPVAPQQPAPSPYAASYGQPAVPAQPAQSAAGGYAPYSPAPAGVNPIGDVGADYDPYAARAEGGSSTTRLILIGCAGLSLFCCCSTILGAVLIDQLCLWNRIPIVYQVLGAFGWAQIC